MDEGSSLFIFFILPPVLGALIGYITNAVAIRMLFRPFNEWRVLGFRVPFTPGIIPRQRGLIAKSIGHMVARELLNEKVLRRRLDSVKFTQGFKTAISGFTGHILGTPLGPGLRGRYAEPVNTLYESLRSGLSGFVESGEFTGLVANHIEKLGGHLLALSVPDPIPGTETDGISGQEGDSGDLFGDFLSGPVPLRVLDLLEADFLEKVRQGNSLSSIFVLPSRENLVILIDRLYGPVFSRLSSVMKTGEVKKEVVRRGRLLLRDILGELSFFQRLVLNAGQYDRVLDEKMPEIADGFIRAMDEAGREGGTRKRIVEALAGEILRTAALPLPEFFAFLGIEAEDGTARLKGAIKKILEDPGFHGLVRRGASAILRDRQEFVRSAADFIVSRIRRAGPEGFARFFSGLSDFLLPAARGRPLGELLSISRERKEKLDIFICERIFALIARKLPEILKSFEIEDLIVERINELDVEEVEDILLSVISRHLSWINIFGAILGALIGCSQVVMQIVRSR